MKHLKLLLCILFLTNCVKGQDTVKPNIIFIVVDDLNDYIEGFNGHPQVLTPNIKALSERGYLFYNTFCNAPVCGPSRTSFLTGKDVAYTQVYNNDGYNEEFRANFADSLGNTEVVTIPEHFKDEGGYFTIGVNKIFHKPSNRDYDNTITDACLKTLSWSKVISFNDFEYIQTLVETYNTGIPECNWGILPDSLESQLKDYRTVDTAITYIDKFINEEIPLCDSAFFMAIGFDAPHLDLYFPEKYFPADFLKDFYATPFNYPYNDPPGTFPYNGIVMPPQPEIRWNDYYQLGPLGKEISASQGDIENSFNNYADDIVLLPEINPDYSDSLRKAIYIESMRANAMMAYMAGVQYMDAQVGRLINYLETQPEVYNNTIIVFVGDNGFSFGEKHHWMKRTFWEPDVRVPFILIDPRKDSNIVCTQNAGLLDLFPTLCDLADIDYPTFDDGSKYLDGRSLIPVINNPDLVWEHPILITFSAEENKECSCAPQMAVRSSKYKYIKYQSDGGDPEVDCLSDLSFTEEELYDIGVNREVDPNEWNNLIDDPNYEPVKSYLQQWLPDSLMYNKNAFTLKIASVEAPCLYAYNDTISLSIDLLDTLGIPTFVPVGYTLIWTNNINDDTLFGSENQFIMNMLSPDDFANNSLLMIYAQLVDESNNAIVGFDLISFFINPENDPNVTFNVAQLDDYTFLINDIEVDGNYLSITWDYGDGATSNLLNPPVHTYDTAGVYEITCYVTYGNDSACSTTFSYTLYIDVDDQNPSNELYLFPNPAHDYINAYLGIYDSSGIILIYDALGKFVYSANTNQFDYPFFYHDLNHLQSGVYLLTYITQKATKTGLFVVD
jgi:arylsulfatase A-like enzyme